MCSPGAGVAVRREVPVLRTLQERGLIADSTPLAELGETLADAAASSALWSPPACVYAGFDPTAASLHIGHLAIVSALRCFSEAGYPVIALVGGATAMIGDPSGRVDDRPVLEQSVVQSNREALAQQLRRLLPQAHVLDNADWWGRLSVVDFLSQTGRYLRLQSMLSRESVKQRLAGEGMTFAELSYQALQAGDFLHLRRQHGVVLQVGGADQWGNITAGIELAKRAAGLTLHGLTVPLLMTGGVKMGKSAGNAVWLDAARTAPFALHHYLYNVPDADAPRLLRVLLGTTVSNDSSSSSRNNNLPGAEEEMPPADKDPRRVQRVLADGVLDWVHGPAATAAVHAAQRALFSSAPLSAADVAAVQRARPPGVRVPRGAVLAADLAALAVQTGLCASRSDAKRLVQAGGLYVNGVRATTHAQTLEEWGRATGMPPLLDGQLVVLRAGRKTHRIVYVEDNS